MQEVFAPFLSTFIRVFLDYFGVFGKMLDHLNHLRMCFERCIMARLSLNPAKCAFERCMMARLSLNPSKCAFVMRRGVLLGHIIFEEGMQIDPAKAEAIEKAKPPTNLKELGRFIGQVKWHNRYLRYLSHVYVPLSRLTQKDAKCEWTKEHQRAFKILKKMLQVAPIM